MLAVEAERLKRDENNSIAIGTLGGSPRKQTSPRTGQLAGFEWGSGVHINQMPPEVAARRLRDEFGKAGSDSLRTFR